MESRSKPAFVEGHRLVADNPGDGAEDAPSRVVSELDHEATGDGLIGPCLRVKNPRIGASSAKCGGCGL
jgi:hypothetical protein